MRRASNISCCSSTACLLGEPGALRRACDGHQALDATAPGQEEFQALLAWCLLSPRRSLAFDRWKGRAFQDLRAYYNWMFPQDGTLAIGWSAPGRVASFLLPALMADADSRRQVTGMPGLRFEEIGRGRIRLRHLPTGGLLELLDPPASASLLRLQLDMEVTARLNKAGPVHLALREWGKLTDDEAITLGTWALAPHAPLLSAIMARIHMLWTHCGSDPELDVNPVTGLPRLSWWDGYSTSELAAHLLSSAIRIPGTHHARGPGHSILLRLGQATLELRGPLTEHHP